MGSQLAKEFGCVIDSEEEFNKDAAIENILRAKNSIQSSDFKNYFLEKDRLNKSILISDDEINQDKFRSRMNN